MNKMLHAAVAETILAKSDAYAAAENAVKEVAEKVLTGKWMPETVNTGRNAAKRAARARIYKGPAKTPKGLRGK